MKPKKQNIKEFKCCRNCFKVQGKGESLRKVLKKYKKKGHKIWAEEKQKDGTTIALLSTNTFPAKRIK